MNIFENYLSKINKVILDNKGILNLENLDLLKNVNLEIPPEKFKFDLSTNISLVLAKANRNNPSKLANESIHHETKRPTSKPKRHRQS